jgi:NAD(P)-dependent dehydrogenase (short-subunit alcohol dehydrogenase family)
MLMSLPDEFSKFCGEAPAYPELAGRRVLITGITSTHGVDIARAFAEYRTRLAVQLDEASEETQALAEVLVPDALDLSVHQGPLTGPEAIVAFARQAATTFGGLDTVINLVPLTLGDAGHDLASVERRISDLMLRPCLIARVAANRMKLTHSAGLILHVGLLPKGATATERAFASAAKAALAAMTRKDAADWADDGIRVNAIAPETGPMSGHALAGEPDVAALALYLASGRGASLAGHIFDAAA